MSVRSVRRITCEDHAGEYIVINVGDVGTVKEVRPDFVVVQFDTVPRHGPTWVFREEIEVFNSRFHLIE